MLINYEKDFEKEIKKDIVIVDFFATWCGPCKMLGPILEDLSDNYKVIKVDIDKNEELTKSFGIMSVPTVHIYKNGQIKKTINGFVTKDVIINAINDIK